MGTVHDPVRCNADCTTLKHYQQFCGVLLVLIGVVLP